TQCASRFLSRALQRYESDCGSRSTLGRHAEGRVAPRLPPPASSGAGHERVEEGAAKLDLWVIAKSRIELPCGTSDEIVKKEQAAVHLILEMEVSVRRNLISSKVYILIEIFLRCMSTWNFYGLCVMIMSK
ncbi:hypothetical protein ALC62_05430, partial [Cyphomyrmex costatus]